MQDIETICPYTGLRSFTEEESLYFKGREEHINKVTAQLEEKKFIMVTGASGDGKSSLIFAGLIPQARAGFFKAHYSNWYVADFRPERAPLKNLAHSLTSALQFDDAATVEVELSRGFSSLVELYKSSDRYLDEKSEEWKNASDERRGKMERQAGNLLILIDQFEEFFTNPENFPGGVPSQESRLLLNIILETIKISLKENLPIYVVCTMRSDYIGQCAAFRGLPEFIGFSQFFVPRLQRKELYQAIEEPAILSGNRISNRLIDRLIFDLEDGTDQLPILQHALKQIWKAASNGREEMDLIHYAMVGGMAGDTLPKELIERFTSWKNILPEYEKAYLENTGLSNVLDIHANKLYEEAADYYNKNSKQEITSKQAKLIIGMSFACLTRIDESRAVRNRMTLQEITDIIHVPELTTEVVDGVLRIFREPENTLIRPFIVEDQSNSSIHPDTVIDITHEALIRNWKLLKKWSDQEYDYYVTFVDFKKQVDRWIEHGKSEDFLLPIGPLTYFENWNKSCRPNQYWINRYNTDDAEPQVKLKKSFSVLKNCRDYLRKSALHLLVTRAFMKYGAKKISMAAGLVALLIMSLYFIYQRHVTSNQYVLDSILVENEKLLADKEVDFFNQSYATIGAEQLKPGFFKKVIQSLPEQRKIDVALSALFTILENDAKCNPPILVQSLLCADSLIQRSGALIDSANTTMLTNHLNNLNDLVRNQSYYLFLRDDDEIAKQLNRNATDQGKLVYRIISNSVKLTDMKALHIAASDALNNKGLSSSEIASLIQAISPLEGGMAASNHFKSLFPEREQITVGFAQNLSHNGGYHMLAHLYAAAGNVKGALQCIDSLKRYNREYDKSFINSTHVSAYFLLYGHTLSFQAFAETYSQKLGVPTYVYVKEILGSAGISYINLSIKFLKRGNVNDNLRLLDQDIRKQLFEFGYTLIKSELKTPDAINYNLALLYKLEGSLADKIEDQRGLAKSDKKESLYRLALSYYEKISPEFLEEKISTLVQMDFVETERRMLPRKHFFLFPDQLKTAEPFSYPTWFRIYGVSFFNFMLRNDLFSKYYKSKDEYQLLLNWLTAYFEQYGQGGNRAFLLYPEFDRSIFISLDSLITKSNFDVDNAWVKLKLIKDYFNSGDTLNAYKHVRSLTFKEFEKWGSGDRDAFHNIKMQVAGELALHGKRTESLGIVTRFSNPKNRIRAYAKLAVICQRNEVYKEAQYYLDSANAEFNRLKNFNGNFHLPLIEVLALQNNWESERKALEYIGSMDWQARFGGVVRMVWGYATIDKYHKSLEKIPPLSSANDRLNFSTIILMRENSKPWKLTEEWKQYNDMLISSMDYIYFDNDLMR